MGNLCNCSECGLLFSDEIGHMLCPQCLAKQEKDYLKVVNVLRDRPGLNVSDVARETGLSESFILRIIRNGSIIVSGQQK